MSDRALFIVMLALELLALYNLYDTGSAMMLHLGKNPYKTTGKILTVNRAMRRDHGAMFFHRPKKGEVDVIDLKCDYLVDLEYETESGETVHLKNYFLPSVMKFSAGSSSAVYENGQEVPLRCSRKFKKLVVVDAPEVRHRQVSWMWLILWVLTSAILLDVLVTLMFTM